METTLTDEEKALAARIGFDEEVLQMVKQETGHGSLTSLSRLRGDEEAGLEGDFDAPDDDGNADNKEENDSGERWHILTVTGIPPEQFDEVLLRLRVSLIDKGFLAFWFEYRQLPSMIAVLKGTDPLSPLEFCNTNGVNYDQGPEEVQSRVAEWRRNFNCDVLGAGFDWAEIRFHTLPPDMDAFARELYDFCPDLLDQGLLIMVDEAYDGLPPERQAEIDAYMEADTGDAEGKSERVALKMLADSVRETRRVHLWWD